VLFGGRQSKEDVLAAIAENNQVFENVIAMANLGAAFASISIFEDSISLLVLISSAKIKSRLTGDEIDKAELFLERHDHMRKATLGSIIETLRKSGVLGRDMAYLEALLKLRNEFVHNLMGLVPLPGDWERFGFTLKEFSQLTEHVTRHFQFASHAVPRILSRRNLILKIEN
jgi:hypothetical protein